MSSYTITTRLSQFARLAVKELREILRDRRTIITLVLMPLFLYPLLGGVVQKVLLSNITKMSGGPVYILGFESEEDLNLFGRYIGITEAKEIKPEERKEAESKVSPEEAVKSLIAQDEEPRFEARIPEDGEEIDLSKLAADRVIDVGIRFQNREPEQGGTVEVEFIYQSGSRFTKDALNALKRRVSDANIAGLLQVSRRTQEPIVVVERPVDPISGNSTFSLVTFIPLALILMTVTGAVYPAIDLTAGERERGTLETLIAAPVSRMGLLMAKFVAVLTVAMLTAMVNLLAMLVTLYTIGLDKAVFGEGGVTGSTIATIIALLFVFAGFFSAVLLSVTSFARSFKEAQAYLIPLMLVALTPGIFSLMPDIQLNSMLAIVPLVNVVLAARDVLQGTIDPTMLAIAMASTVVYGLLAMVIATRVFGTDAILYGSDGTWSDLLKRPAKTLDMPRVSTGMLCLVVLVPTFMVLSSAAGRIQDATMQTRLLLTMLVQSLFVLVPLMFVWWNRYSIRETFRLLPPRVLAIVGCILLGTSLWPFAYELTALAAGEARQLELHRLFAPLKDKIMAIPLPLRVLSLALVPAVCEEWFFRGVLLSSLLGEHGRSSKRRYLSAILISSAIFAAFHVLVQDKLFFERFLPSCLMGIILAWVCIRTGSLFPGMLLHSLHNGLLLAAGDFEGQLGKLGLNLENEQHLPAAWLVGAAVIAFIGFMLIRGGSRSKSVENLSLVE
ncbi:MAG: ABC transporter permease subunit/CPBP intramembrane protease, partial [Planctomycetaceae bacterium]